MPSRVVAGPPASQTASAPDAAENVLARVEPLITVEDRAALEAEMAAAARGDAQAAWEHNLAGLVVVESIARYKLRELALLGHETPGWMFARWCVDQAYRWLLVEKDPRTDAAVIDTMAAVACREAEGLTEPTKVTELGTRLAAGHWMWVQVLAAAYEQRRLPRGFGGGLHDVLVGHRSRRPSRRG